MALLICIIKFSLYWTMHLFILILLLCCGRWELKKEKKIRTQSLPVKQQESDRFKIMSNYFVDAYTHSVWSGISRSQGEQMMDKGNVFQSRPGVYMKDYRERWIKGECCRVNQLCVRVYMRLRVATINNSCIREWVYMSSRQGIKRTSICVIHAPKDKEEVVYDESNQ